MYSTVSAYQTIPEDDYLPLPKKRFSIGFLFKLRSLLILFLAVLLAYEAWPKIHPSSYRCFVEMVLLITSREVFEIVVSSFLEGFAIHPIARSIELLVIATCIWKLVFRLKIRAFLRIKSMVMIALASFWIYTVLFPALNIKAYPIWMEFMAFFTYSPMLAYLYPFGLDTAMTIYAVIAIFILCYVITVLFYGSATREGQRLGRQQEMEEMGISEVMRRVNPLRKLFLPRPRFYVTDSFSQNAYSSGRNIVIAIDIFDEDIEVAQGVIAHELGYYYHYDTDASMICNVAINTVAFPLMLVTFVFRILSYIPFLVIAAGIYGVLLTVFGAVAGIIFKLVNIIFYWIDGKWAERSADLFGVDLGFGFGNYLFLSKYADGISIRALLSAFLDVHPGIRSRCRSIKKRIIRNYGEDYWDGCVAVYGDYYV